MENLLNKFKRRRNWGFPLSPELVYEIIFFLPLDNSIGIGIGVCGPNFACQNEMLAELNDSIGILHKGIIRYDNKEIVFASKEFSKFYKEDVVGLRLIYSPTNSMLQCFATSKGELLGMGNLPPKFAEMELFPAVNLCMPGDLLRANFGKKKWRYNPWQLV